LEPKYILSLHSMVPKYLEHVPPTNAKPPLYYPRCFIPKISHGHNQKPEQEAHRHYKELVDRSIGLTNNVCTIPLITSLNTTTMSAVHNLRHMPPRIPLIKRFAVLHIHCCVLPNDIRVLLLSKILFAVLLRQLVGA